MKKLLFILLCLSLFFVSCSKIATDQVEESKEFSSLNEAESYYISLDQALCSLDEFFQMQETKSIASREISETFIVDSPSITKNSDNTALFHIVNFKNEKGYAILSADTRIPSEVLAVTERGSVSKDAFMVDSAADFSPAYLVYSSVMSYLGDAPGGFDEPDSVRILPPDPPELEEGEFEITVIRWGPWENIREVPVMLETAWGQESPYNKRISSGNSAGCTTTAGAQVFTYNGVPESINDVVIPYEVLKKKRSVSDTSVYADSVAILFADIYYNCKPKDTGSGTLIWPKHLVKYMKSNGYSNVELYKSLNYCDMNRVYISLDKGYPVIMSAKANAFNAHTWVVDGYVKQRRSGQYIGWTTGSTYGGKTETREFVHCNWGWDGVDDGYFYSGVFNRNEPAPYASSKMSSLLPDSDGNYDSWYRIITYDII